MTAAIAPTRPNTKEPALPLAVDPARSSEVKATEAKAAKAAKAAEVSGPPLDHNSATVNIPVSKIVRSPWNRHATVDDEWINHIREHGVLQNLILRPIKATIAHVTENIGISPQPFAIGESIYQLVSGERRWLGAKKAGRATVPAVVRELEDAQAIEIQIAENDKRKDLNAMEKSRAYSMLVRQYQEDHKGDPKFARKDAIALAAERCKKEPRTVYQIIQLENLTPAAKDMLHNAEIEASHGYELCRRTAEEQDRLIDWLRKERDHSHGDLPSVRRLKREIELIDRENEEKKAQQKLFAGSEASSAPEANVLAGKSGSTATSAAVAPADTRVAQPLSAVSPQRQAALERMKAPGGATVQEAIAVSALKMAERINPRNSHLVVIDTPGGLRVVKGVTDPTVVRRVRVNEIESRDWFPVHTSALAKRSPEPPTAAQLKAREEAERKAEQKHEREMRRIDRQNRIDKKYREKFFIALASNLKLDQRVLGHVLPDFLFELWENGDILPDVFAPQLLGWPEPKDKAGYSYQEVRDHAKKYTKKFSAGLLAAILLYLNTAPAGLTQLARYCKVDPKKLRKKAAEEVEAERLRVPEPKTAEEKALWRALHHFEDAEKRWGKLRKSGATDAQIRAMLSEELGDGGSGGPNLPWVSHKGGSNPRVWFAMTASGNPDLAGAELIAKVRELLNIEAS